MVQFAARRVLLAIPVMFGVSVMVFGIMHLLPGGPCADHAGRVW